MAGMRRGVCSMRLFRDSVSFCSVPWLSVPLCPPGTSEPSTKFFAVVNRLRNRTSGGSCRRFRGQAGSRILHFCPHSIGQHSDTWSQLTPREAQKHQSSWWHRRYIKEVERTQSIASAQYHIHINTTQPPKQFHSDSNLWEVQRTDPLQCYCFSKLFYCISYI